MSSLLYHGKWLEYINISKVFSRRLGIKLNVPSNVDQISFYFHVNKIYQKMILLLKYKLVDI